MGLNPDMVYSSSLKDYTEEQKVQHHINNVIDKMDCNKSFNIDEERHRDWKINALNEIAELRTILEIEGEDLSHIPMPTRNDNDDVIRDVRTTLQYKNNRNMDYSLAENIACAAAYGVEAFFDGERVVFGSRVDMSGWHINVKNRIRRRKYETTEFVGGVMREYNVGTGVRLILELSFDAFMHYKSVAGRKLLDDGTTIPSDVNVRDALSDIQNDLTDANNISASTKPNPLQRPKIISSSDLSAS
jgi:ribosomal protein L21E